MLRAFFLIAKSCSRVIRSNLTTTTSHVTIRCFYYIFCISLKISAFAKQEKKKKKALCGTVWKQHHRIRVFAETSTRWIVQLINFQQNKQKTFSVPIFSKNRICCSSLPYETVNCPIFIRSVQKKKSQLPTEDSDKMQVAYSHCWFVFLINKSYMHAANTTSSLLPTSPRSFMAVRWSVVFTVISTYFEFLYPHPVWHLWGFCFVFLAPSRGYTAWQRCLPAV